MVARATQIVSADASRRAFKHSRMAGWDVSSRLRLRLRLRRLSVCFQSNCARTHLPKNGVELRTMRIAGWNAFNRNARAGMSFMRDAIHLNIKRWPLCEFACSNSPQCAVRDVSSSRISSCTRTHRSRPNNARDRQNRRAHLPLCVCADVYKICLFIQ